MNLLRTAGAALLGILSLGVITSAYADEKAAAARSVAAKHADALVTIKLVIKEKFSMDDFGSEESEYTMEAGGVVVNSDGLIVASLSETDPAKMMDDMFGFGEEEGMDVETSIGSLKIVRPDGAEVPGEIVIRDNDLDLAFIRPESKPQTPWTAVSASQGPDAEGHDAQQFDEVLVLYRLGTVAGRACGGEFARIQAVMHRPRKFFVLGEWPGYLGAPAFTLDGRWLGIVTLRTINVAAGSGSGLFSMDEPETASVILPVPDLLESASQAPGYDD